MPMQNATRWSFIALFVSALALGLPAASDTLCREEERVAAAKANECAQNRFARRQAGLPASARCELDYEREASGIMDAALERGMECRVPLFADVVDSNGDGLVDAVEGAP